MTDPTPTPVGDGTVVTVDLGPGITEPGGIVRPPAPVDMPGPRS